MLKGLQTLQRLTTWLIVTFLYRASFQHKKWKTNWCHCFNFIHISTDLYMFRAHRPIFRKIRTAVHTTIGSVSVPFWTDRTRVQNGTDTEPMVVGTAVRILLKMGLWARNMYRSVDIWIKLKKWHQLVFHFLYLTTWLLGISATYGISRASFTSFFR